MDTYTLHRGTAPLLISLPHDGTAVPADIAAGLTESARRVPDTDWHVSKLYGFARELGASMIVPKYSRYVIDLNRPPDDVSLYPGQNTTGLSPHVQFSGEPVYRDGQGPDEAEVAEHVERYWRPYHRALAGELQRIHAQHGRAGLWEGHSIKGVVPFLFEGRLPDLNLGTAAGTSCSAALQSRLESVLQSQDRHDFVVNGRFKGGYITRQYGDPAQNIQAVQLEISQRIYMEEETFAWDDAKAARTQLVLKDLLRQMLA
jgi:N-formylglutamate deformylase